MKKGPQIHSDSYLVSDCTVTGMVEIGEMCSVWHHAVLRGDVDRITVGKGTNLQDGCLVHCTEGMATIVGEYCTIGHGVILHSCTVGDGSLIGMGTVILDGARIGKQCLVGAGSLVTQETEIPDGSLVLGRPAKVHRALLPEEISKIRENAMEYIRLAQEQGRT